MSMCSNLQVRHDDLAPGQPPLTTKGDPDRRTGELRSQFFGRAFPHPSAHWDPDELGSKSTFGVDTSTECIKFIRWCKEDLY
jgi:hypothetical protein